MKKSLILAASLAAVVLGGGVLAGCSDDSSSSSYILPSADTLLAPVGTPPFKTGNYEWKEELKWGEEEDPPFTQTVSVNAEERTIEMEMEGEVHKYTYNENTHKLTMALYQRNLPKDMDKYLDSLIIGGEAYDGGYKWADRAEYTNAWIAFLAKFQLRYNDSVYAGMPWGEYYAYTMESIADFNTLDVYDYKVVDENIVELTLKGYDFEDGESWEKKVTLTFTPSAE